MTVRDATYDHAYGDYVSLLRQVHLALSDDPHPDFLPGGDKFIRGSILERLKRYALVTYDEYRGKYIFYDYRLSKWFYVRRLVADVRSTASGHEWRAGRDRILNSLTVLATLAKTSYPSVEEIDYLGSGIERFVGEGDSRALQAALDYFVYMNGPQILRRVNQKIKVEIGSEEPLLEEKAEEARKISAMYFAGMLTELNILRLDDTNWHWLGKRMRVSVPDRILELLESQTHPARFIDNVVSESNNILLIDEGYRNIPNISSLHSMVALKLLDDLYVLAHKHGDAFKPILMKIGWDERRQAITIETPNDGRLFGKVLSVYNKMMGEHPPEDERSVFDETRKLRAGNPYWWVEAGKDSARMVIPLGRMRMFGIWGKLSERVLGKMKEVDCLLARMADGDGIEGAEFESLRRGIEYLRSAQVNQLANMRSALSSATSLENHIVGDLVQRLMNATHNYLFVNLDDRDDVRSFTKQLVQSKQLSNLFGVLPERITRGGGSLTVNFLGADLDVKLKDLAGVYEDLISLVMFGGLLSSESKPVNLSVWWDGNRNEVVIDNRDMVLSGFLADLMLNPNVHLRPRLLRKVIGEIEIEPRSGQIRLPVQVESFPVEGSPKRELDPGSIGVQDRTAGGGWSPSTTAGVYQPGIENSIFSGAGFAGGMRTFNQTI